MGMVAYFCTVDAATLDRLRADPELMTDYVMPEDVDADPPNCMDIDKSWHCLHFMLTGTAAPGTSPLSWAILGGEDCGDDVGYGPPRVLTPAQVHQIVDALAAIDEPAFRASFDPQAMADADIYLGEAALAEGQEFLDYLVDQYLQVAELYRTAAARDDGVILWLS